jgi:hypothetical protein
MAIPSAADIDVDECPTPKASYSLSSRLGKSADAAILAVGMKHFAAAGEYLMAVSLVAYIPYQLIVGGIVDVVQGLP